MYCIIMLNSGWPDVQRYFFAWGNGGNDTGTHFYSHVYSVSVINR